MSRSVKRPSALNRLLTFPYFLSALACIYVGVYFALPYTPGNSPLTNPVGWWGWLDQSLYLKAAQALSVLNFSADQYFYPPLYPAFGAPFLLWSSGHPFFFVNLVCLLWFAYVFVCVCDCYLPRAVGIFLFFVSTVAEILVFENFVIPWSTNLSAALLASGILGLVWLQEMQQGQRTVLRSWQVLWVATSLGMIVPTRPVDALLGMVVGCAFIWKYFQLDRASNLTLPQPLRFWMLILVGASLGPAIFFGFNRLIHGGLLGNYLQIASGHGFFLSDLPEKAYSIWLNAQPLYGEVGIALVQRYPWLLLSLAGMVWISLRGDFLLRILALTIAIFYVVYMPYGDLLPSGIWRYLNIHYFKWTFPFFALFACWLLQQLLEGVQARAGWQGPSAVLLLVPFLLLSLQMKTTVEPILVSQEKARALRFELPSHPIDFIDLKGLTGYFPQVYFGEHALTIDGQALKLYRDFRLLDQEDDLRIVFIRPITGKTLVLLPDSHLRSHEAQLNAQAGRYHFVLAMPGLASALLAPRVVAGYRSNQVLDFSNQGASNFYIGTGFSIPENAGRWTLDQEALVNLRLLNFLPTQKAQLVMTYKPLLATPDQCQRVLIAINHQEIGAKRVCWQAKGNELQTDRYDIPVGVIGQDGIVQVQIKTPDSISPYRLQINSDERQLGIYLQELTIAQ